MVGLDDIGVNQVSDQFGFPDKVIDELLLVGVVLANDLDGDALDETARAQLLDFVNDPHASFVKLAYDLVSKLILDREEGHGAMLIKRQVKSSLSWAPTGAVNSIPRIWPPLGVATGFLVAR